MKKTIAILLAILVCVAIFPACTGAGQNDNSADGHVTVVVTTHAAYDMVREMIKDLPAGVVTLVKLGRPGQDMHDFEPTAADITTLATADLVVATGGASEGWMTATLRAAMNEKVAVVSMMATCGVAAGESEHDHDHAEGEACVLTPGDEHVWLSPENGVRIATAVRDALLAALRGETFSADKPAADTTDPTEAAVATLERTAAAYLTALAALRDDYAAMVAAAGKKTIVIADRNPFGYLVHDLGLTCYAAFPGCSSETSASFATQTMLIEKTRDSGLAYIFVIDGSDAKVAETVAAETSAEILSLDSLQVVVDEQKTYLGAMQANLEALRRALT